MAIAGISEEYELSEFVSHLVSPLTPGFIGLLKKGRNTSQY